MKKKNNKFILGVKKMPYNALFRANRLRLGYTQKQLAKVVGVSQQYISQMERMRKWPTVTQAHEIADVLECDVDKLFPEWMADKLLPKQRILITLLQ